jgi:hypothetical protein
MLYIRSLALLTAACLFGCKTRTKGTDSDLTSDRFMTITRPSTADIDFKLTEFSDSVDLSAGDKGQCDKKYFIKLTKGDQTIYFWMPKTKMNMGLAIDFLFPEQVLENVRIDEKLKFTCGVHVPDENYQKFKLADVFRIKGMSYKKSGGVVVDVNFLDP